MLNWIDRVSYSHPYSTSSLLSTCQWLSTHPVSNRLEATRACVRPLERANARLSSPETGAALSEGRGSVALAEDDPARAAELFRQAVAGWASLGRPYDQIRALSNLGYAVLRTGDAVAAQTIFDQARRLVDTLARELDDSELRSLFLASPLIQEIHAAGS